jgi:indolepyruvate ferredoxin oxidoreductase beta subunit
MSARRISVAIVAMGGQGGGVLADWLRDAAEQNHWLAQNTSVPGVAQRTGATIYYIELIEPGDAGRAEPVMALMPVPGDVDLVIASEWMETGRAIMRGLVTPDKTTLIASTHREYATTEKIVPGNGMVDPEGVAAAAKAAAKQLIAFDLSKVATDNSSVISASLLGAIAASEALPFSDESFENAIKNGGVGVNNSLKAFSAGRERARECMGQVVYPADPGNALPTGFSGLLAQRIKAELPEAAWPLAFEGVRRCVDYLDADYANEYLDRIKGVSAANNSDELISEVCRWLALRMCYEDPIRVADLKLRADRFNTIRKEVNAQPNQLVHQTEYLHPRVEEIADSLPAKWGKELMRRPRLRAWVDNTFCNGSKLRTTSVSGHLTMHWLAQRTGWRRRSLRHQRESSHIDAWINNISSFAQTDPQLASAAARLARLIKGYGDTHSHGSDLFARLSGVAEELANSGGDGKVLDRMIDAALQSRSTEQLDTLLAEHRASIGNIQQDL